MRLINWVITGILFILIGGCGESDHSHCTLEGELEKSVVEGSVVEQDLRDLHQQSEDVRKQIELINKY